MTLSLTENLPPNDESSARQSLTQTVLNHISNHRTHRKFLPKEIPNELLKTIISTGLRSSTNGNMQTYSIIVTTEKDELKKLAIIHDNSNIANASVLLTFCADWRRMILWCKCRKALKRWNGVKHDDKRDDNRDDKPEANDDTKHKQNGDTKHKQNGDTKHEDNHISEEEDNPYSNFNAFLTGALDVMVAAQSIALCAEAANLGICFLGSTIWEPKRIADFLDLPEYVHPVTSMILGFPDPEVQVERKARLDMEGIVHWGGKYERYKGPADKGGKNEKKKKKTYGKSESPDGSLGEKHPDEEVQKILDLYKEREHEGWERYKNLYGEAWVEKLESHGLENLAQVYTRLKYSGPDFRKWSRRFLKSLADKGFGRNEEEEGDREVCEVCGKLSHCLDEGRFKGELIE